MKAFKTWILTSFLLMIVLPACDQQNKQDHTGHETAEYSCPMHPEITRQAAGSCPICGMDLVKKEPAAKADQLVELDVLLKPTNQVIVSTIPVTTLKQKAEDIKLDVVGTVTYDTRQTGSISSRVSGRIEKLYIRYKYQPVQKGQKIMEIYSPELATAQQQLLFLLKNDPGNTALISAAQERLLLQGFNRQQVNQLVASKKINYSIPVYSGYSGFVTDPPNNNLTGPGMNTANSTSQELSTREGMYLQKGQTAFSVYNAGKVWILLNLFPEQQGFIKVGSPVSILPETAPDENINATIGYIEPIFRQGSKTLTARVYYNNEKLRLPIGSRVRATVFGNTGPASWLPKESVISLGRNKMVFIKEPGGFRARQIVTGSAMNNSIQVIHGLALTDSVATNAQYLVDNESFIKIK